MSNQRYTYRCVCGERKPLNPNRGPLGPNNYLCADLNCEACLRGPEACLIRETRCGGTMCLRPECGDCYPTRGRRYESPADSPVPDPRRGPNQNVLRTLPENPAERKEAPITTGVLDYFPLAIAEVARLSKAGNDQHNPGQPMHWAREKSTDHADCISRHLIQRGTLDTDGMRHTAKIAWRALAMLQEELEAEAGFNP